MKRGLLVSLIAAPLSGILALAYFSTQDARGAWSTSNVMTFEMPASSWAPTPLATPISINFTGFTTGSEGLIQFSLEGDVSLTLTSPSGAIVPLASTAEGSTTLSVTLEEAGLWTWELTANNIQHNWTYSANGTFQVDEPPIVLQAPPTAEATPTPSPDAASSDSSADTQPADGPISTTEPAPIATEEPLLNG